MKERGVKRFLLVLLSVLLLAACSLPVKKAEDSDMLLKDHPLAGKIWDVNAEQFISQQQLAERVVESSDLFLGETHDNLKHHQGQAWVVSLLRESQRSAVVAFEMISQQQGQVIAGKQYDSAESLIAGLNHIKTNWEYSRLYGNIFSEALQAGYTVLPANFDRQEIMAIARKGEAELPPKIKKMLDDHALPADQVAASRKEIEGSHCGMINEEMTTAMMLVQRAKDAQMALAFVGQDNVDARVLVAGSGHVRKDRGVPFYVQPQGKLLTIAWAEMQEEAVDAAAYA